MRIEQRRTRDSGEVAIKKVSTRKAQREVFVAVAGEISGTLCSFCQFSHFDGSPCSGDAYAECQHPLSEQIFPYEGPEPGQDCWGFRPALDIEDAADIAGMIIAHGWNNWSWVHGKERIKVWGRKE